MHSLNRRAWVDIDLGALLRNGEQLKKRANAPLLPMVKADAYGLGAERVARKLESLDPWGFGVATIAEAEQLRAVAIKRPIVIFTPILPGDFDAALRAHVTPTLGDAAAIARWAETGRPWQLAIDTGMNRAGVRWDEIDCLLDAIAAYPPQGAFTHFHSAEKNDASRTAQEERFAAALARLPVRPAMIHAENSPAIEHRGPSQWTVARPGIFLYGVGTDSDAVTPEPVASLRARIVDLRTVPDGETVSYSGTYRVDGDRLVATLAIGYGDGYRRALSNRGSVLVSGIRVPVIGNVTMDMTMIDVTDVPCAIGDVATLIGADGDDHIDVREVAAFGEISPYEVLTSLRGRLPRRYIGGDE